MPKQQVGAPPCTSLQMSLITIHEVLPCSFFSIHSDADYISKYPEVYTGDRINCLSTVPFTVVSCHLLGKSAVPCSHLPPNPFNQFFRFQLPPLSEQICIFCTKKKNNMQHISTTEMKIYVIRL